MKHQDYTHIIEEYRSGSSCNLLSKKYNIPKNTLFYHFHLDGVVRSRRQNRKYITHDDYFSIIDSEDKAYLLGFVFADGCIYGTRLSVVVNEKDKDVIETFKQFISPDRTLLAERGLSGFLVDNKRLTNDLRKYGLIERKSLIIKFPENLFDTSLLPHFIRGVFDGDGSVYKLKCRKGTYGFKIVGSNFFIPALVDILKKYGIVLHTGHIGKVMYCHTTKQSELLKLFSFLYQDSRCYLGRKHRLFLEIKNDLEDRNHKRINRENRISQTYLV